MAQDPAPHLLAPLPRLPPPLPQHVRLEVGALLGATAPHAGSQVEDRDGAWSKGFPLEPVGLASFPMALRPVVR